MPRRKLPAAVAPVDTKNLFLRGTKGWARINVNGERKQVALRTSDVKEAQKLRDDLVRQADNIRAGRLPEAPVVIQSPPKVRLWEDAVEGWLRVQEADDLEQGETSTSRRYKVSVRQLSLSFEGEELTSINKGAIIDWVLGRKEAMKAASTIRNDVTALGKVLAHAFDYEWIPSNPVTSFDRKKYIRADEDAICPPEDYAISCLISEIGGWSQDMANLVLWLRETGMRLHEALSIWREDVHPCGTRATLRRGVKRNRAGARTRTIFLGRAAALLRHMPSRGRLFAKLHPDSDVVSSRYGQWHRQRQGREDRAAAAEGRQAVQLERFRLHDLRHSFAIATMIDDRKNIYELQQHLGHTQIGVTEKYIRFLKGEGAQRVHYRRPDLFGSMPLGDPNAQVKLTLVA
jgi:site-specific recombinase XerD